MIEYSEDWLVSLLFRAHGSVGGRSSLFAVPCAIFAGLLVAVDEWDPDLRGNMGILDLDKSQLWSATTAVLGLLLAFRTNRAMARFWEGTGLLHQMRGEWFDSISCCVTFSVGAVATKREEVMRFRHTAIRLMSLCHGSALEEIAGDSGELVETIDPFGLNNETLNHLNACKETHRFNRVEVLLHLTQSIITKALEDGILKIPPPILSRVYQTLSRGFVNLLNAKKIADTRFPFPYAQLIAGLLFTHCLLTPLFISAVVPHKIWAPVITFIPIFAMFSLNFIGVELENPFGSDANDLPLDHFQGEMNKCLMMLLHEGADLIANVSPNRCIMDYGSLASTLLMNQTHEDPTAETTHKAARLTDFGNLSKHCIEHLDGTEESPVDAAPSNQSYLTRQGSMDSQDPWSKDGLRRGYAANRMTSWDSEASQARSHSTPPVQEVNDLGELEYDPVTDTMVSAATDRFPKPVGGDPGSRPKAKFYDDCKDELPVLKELVEAQVRELSRSILALAAFSDSLPGIVDNILSSRERDPSSNNHRPWNPMTAHANGMERLDERILNGFSGSTGDPYRGSAGDPSSGSAGDPSRGSASRPYASPSRGILSASGYTCLPSGMLCPKVGDRHDRELSEELETSHPADEGEGILMQMPAIAVTQARPVALISSYDDASTV